MSAFLTRRLAVAVCALGAATVVSACATTSTATVPSVPGGSTGARTDGMAGSPPAASVQAGPQWSGPLVAKNGSGVTGSVTVRAAGDAQTQASLTVAGAPAGGVHPWHIHTGTCAQMGTIVGPPTAYTAVSVSGDGAGTVLITLPIATPGEGTYSVNVHESPANMGTIVACADLTKS